MLSYDLVLKVMSRPMYVMQVFPVVEFPLVFDIHDKSSCPLRFKCNLAMNQAQLLAGEPVQDICNNRYMTPSQVTKNVCVNNSSKSRVTGMGEMSLHLSCHDASPDMEHDLPKPCIRSCHLTGLRSNFQIDLLGSKCIGETGVSLAGFSLKWHKFGMIKNINICLLSFNSPIPRLSK